MTQLKRESIIMIKYEHSNYKVIQYNKTKAKNHHLII